MNVNEVLTVEEIQSRFDSEWVLLDELVTDEANHVQSGRVLAHSRNRDEVDRCLLELRPRHYAAWFTGRMPEDAAIVL